MEQEFKINDVVKVKQLGKTGIVIGVNTHLRMPTMYLVEQNYIERSQILVHAVQASQLEIVS